MVSAMGEAACASMHRRAYEVGIRFLFVICEERPVWQLGAVGGWFACGTQLSHFIACR